MSYLGLMPPDIYNPNDPSSKFYCDSAGVDDPACYQDGGYYGPGGPGDMGPPTRKPPTTEDGGGFTLPVQVFTNTVPVPVSMPVPVYSPIPTTLNYPDLTVPGPGIAPLLAIGALLALLTMTKKGGR